MSDKPTEHLNWNPSGSNVEKPEPTIIESGYPKGSVYPTKEHSWILNLVDRWNKFFDYITDKNKTDIANLSNEFKNHNHDEVYAKSDGSTDFPKIIINSSEITVVD